jgi:hypothetical protein
MRRREQPVFGVKHVLAVAAAAAVVTGGVISAAQAATHKVTIDIVGISRTGTQVAVQSTVVPLAGNALPSSGPKYSVTPGTYFIGASVPTYSSGTSGTLVSQTIVERRLRVTRSGTIRLDARGGKPVSVWLDGRDLGSPGMAGGCIRGGFGVVYAYPPAPQLYVQPVRAKGLGFDWAVGTAGPNGSYYDLAGGTNNALPSSPEYRVRSSGLAKVVMQARAGTVPDQTARLLTSATLPDRCSLPGLQTSMQIPSAVVDYRTPGFWETEVTTFHDLGLTTCSDTWIYGSYAARRSYLASFENAAHGPSTAVPYVAGPLLSFDPNHQFIDPLTTGYEYCNVTTVSLSSGGRLVKKERFTGLVARGFSARVRAGRRYSLTVSAAQTAPHETMPAGLLSPKTTLTWRFKARQGPVPVAVFAFLPLGLNITNLARPASLTYVRAWPTQGNYQFAPGKASAARSFVAEASSNDGRTWRKVRAVRHKGFWLLAVRNPQSGFVSLRATVISSSGDTSIETIYRAYGIS